MRYSDKEDNSCSPTARRNDVARLPPRPYHLLFCVRISSCGSRTCAYIMTRYERIYHDAISPSSILSERID